MAEFGSSVFFGDLTVTGNIRGNFPSGTITIPTSGWSSNAGGTTVNFNVLKIDIAITGVTATSFVEVIIPPDSQGVATTAGINPTCVEYNGGITLYCNTTPGSAITAKYIITNR